jgi:membrane fusion protein (multidrug efflux system)
MRTVRRALCWTTGCAAVLVTFWLGYTRPSGEATVEERPVPVEVAPVGVGSIEQTLEVTGWVTAQARVEVASKIAGRIESLSVAAADGSPRPVEVGLRVARGRQLAVIDHDVHLAQVTAAEAEVKTREARLAEAQRERKRIVGLFEKGSITEQARDQAVTADEVAAAGLNLAKANLELARINLRESRILSPIDGIVTAKHIDEGNLVTPGQRIVSLADIRTVKVLVAVPERYGPQVRQGLPARMVVDGLPGRTFETQVYCVYPTLDEQTGTFRVEMRLSNDEILLRPGMFARVTLILDRKDNVVVIPRDVILGGKLDKPYVYVIESGVARKRLVAIGLTQGERNEITAGLDPGATLVINGMHYLADGLRADVVRLEDIR